MTICISLPCIWTSAMIVAVSPVSFKNLCAGKCPVSA